MLPLWRKWAHRPVVFTLPWRWTGRKSNLLDCFLLILLFDFLGPLLKREFALHNTISGRSTTFVLLVRRLAAEDLLTTAFEVFLQRIVDSLLNPHCYFYL